LYEQAMCYILLRYAEINSAPEIWSQISISFIFHEFSRFSCELNIWSGKEKTLEPKLEAKKKIPGPLVGTSWCAWTCSIWFVRHH